MLAAGTAAPNGRRMSNFRIRNTGVVVVWVAAATAISWVVWDQRSGATPNSLSYVRSETCAECHQAEAKSWRSSQHAHAMADATTKSVLGDFDNANFEYFGTRSRFFQKDGKFFVETDGPDGKLATFEIKYTFGLYPLQQYLIEFPDGRIQALSIAWDSRPRRQGGEHWFHLYPKEDVRHNDILRWTKLYQNWNHMCAECHSTEVHKNYDVGANRFATTWSEISVGCEACHGPGSRHVAWAKGEMSNGGQSNDPLMGFLARFDERRAVSWLQDPKTGTPQRSKSPALLRKEVETCGRCHARRGEFSENWLPGQWLSDTHEVSSLDRTTFSADGQMRDNEETYNYAAFKQSKMFAKGVTCSDCHDPHTAALRLSGSSVCLQCHATEKYATVAHSHHEVSSSVTCISCHMPVRSYMVVDRRHDHSFRLPRPDLSVKLGTANACNDCHKDKTAQWAATAVRGLVRAASAWAFSTTQERSMPRGPTSRMPQDCWPAAQPMPRPPAFVRASAFSGLNGQVAQVDVQLARKGLADPDPMVRVGALDMLRTRHHRSFGPSFRPFYRTKPRRSY